MAVANDGGITGVHRPPDPRLRLALLAGGRRVVEFALGGDLHDAVAIDVAGEVAPEVAQAPPPGAPHLVAAVLGSWLGAASVLPLLQ